MSIQPLNSLKVQLSFLGVSITNTLSIPCIKKHLLLKVQKAIFHHRIVVFSNSIEPVDSSGVLPEVGAGFTPRVQNGEKHQVALKP